jgi:hypothetical protein
MNRIPAIVALVLSSLSSPLGLDAQRLGGEIRKRKDDQNRFYFEVFADHINGNHGEPAPMRTGSTAAWPLRVEIRGESYWMIDKSAAGRVDADGVTGTARTLVAPEFPRGALIVRWVSVDAEAPPHLISDALPTKPLSGWILVGKKTTLDLPIPSKIAPRPFRALWQGMIPGIGQVEEFRYTPLVLLQYLCNDEVESFGDNDGWLHVYQTWIW